MLVNGQLQMSLNGVGAIITEAKGKLLVPDGLPVSACEQEPTAVVDEIILARSRAH